jgi:hypothetical protein
MLSAHQTDEILDLHGLLLPVPCATFGMRKLKQMSPENLAPIAVDDGLPPDEL